MTVATEPLSSGGTRVHDETPVRPPPIRVTGPLAWMRRNLFATPFDAVLTVITSIILVWLVTGFLAWAISQANWLVVTRNFRLFMAGTFPVEDLWRVHGAVLLCTFAIGYSMYAYLRLPRWTLWALLILAAVLIIAPPVLYAATPPAPSLLAAGDRDIASGTVTETPIAQRSFIGRAGETVRLELAAAPDDQALAAATGFSDRAAAALLNGARNRLRTQTRQAELTAQLAGDTLTTGQRNAAQETLASLTIPDSPIETYALNLSAVDVSLINATTGDVVADGTISPDAPNFSATLPQDGWYILETTVTDESVGLLVATGVEPILERGLSGGLVYSRVLDDFTVSEARPMVDGDELPYTALTDNQWQGTRTLSQYLRVFAAPMLEMLARGLIPLMVVGMAGYSVAWGLGRVVPRPERELGNRHWAAQRSLGPLWIVVLVLSFLLLLGMPGSSPATVASVLARFVWVGWVFFVGMAFDRPWGRPLFGLLIILALFQSLLEEGVFTGRMQNGLVGLLISMGVWMAIGGIVARRGAGSRGRLQPAQLVAAILVCAALWLAILLVPALLGVAGEPLPAVDTRRWGGLLLTAVITVVALIASFPLGILLALGRRSSLPLVSGVCTVYIELVRGVPLITVLFMAMLLVPLLNPGLASVENAFRAIVGFTLFSAAYLAENVRGGLQSVPFGQEEAGRALGLSGWQVIVLITLPQALRAVIPALVGQCIALFKDTSLVVLVGLTDLTGMSKGVISQAEYVGLQTEVYVFISIMYFVFSYAMAFVSRRIEASGSGKARRL